MSQFNITDQMAGAGPTEAEAIAQIAETSFKPVEIDPAKVYVSPHAQQLVNLEDLLPTPRRQRERTVLHTAAALGAFVEKFMGAGTALYADLEARTIIGIFNGSTATDPGWNDHRASLELRHTPEWKHWFGKDNQMLPQVAFAEHVEDGLDAIVAPPAADMLELAQTFSAKRGVEFKSANQLGNGDRQLLYIEETNAKAGQSGQIQIPPTFTLALAPFEGCALYKMEARLRYRISEGHLLLGYKLVRPDEVLRETFDDIVATVEKTTGRTAYRGKPPVR